MQTAQRTLNQVSPSELRQRLDRAGYDVRQIEGIGHTLQIDLIELLAGWTPVLVSVFAPSQLVVNNAPQPQSTKQQPSWFRRVWRAITGEH